MTMYYDAASRTLRLIRRAANSNLKRGLIPKRKQAQYRELTTLINKRAKRDKKFEAALNGVGFER